MTNQPLLPEFSCNARNSDQPVLPESPKVIFWSKIERDDEDDRRKPGFVLKGYTVFNAEQIDGLPTKPPVTAPTVRWTPHARAEELLRRSRADIRHGGNRAYYQPELDFIALPVHSAFDDAGGYYNTALHELAHWTGHANRCARNLSGRFGQHAYAAEELVAEITSAYTCAALGVQGHLQHAEYVAAWLRVLRNDKRAIFTAAAQAQRAADYLLAFDTQAAPVAQAA